MLKSGIIPRRTPRTRMPWSPAALSLCPAKSRFGRAATHGGGPALRAGESVSTISGTPSGLGYWLFTTQGRAFAYGDAKFFGDMGAVHLNGPVIASVATPTGRGVRIASSRPICGPMGKYRVRSASMCRQAMHKEALFPGFGHQFFIHLIRVEDVNSFG